MNRFDKLKAFVAENKSGSRYHKICDGLTRVRVLKNLNEDELDFYSDGYHKIDEVHFVDCEDRKTCPVCAVLRTLWDPNDPEKQRLYREVKRIERHQFQVALLTNDGRDLSKEVAVMITLPKTAMDLILAECLDQGFEPSERDLVIVKKSKGGVYDFTGTHFEQSLFDMPEKVLASRVQLGANRNYNDTSWKPFLQEQIDNLHPDFEMELLASLKK